MQKSSSSESIFRSNFLEHRIIVDKERAADLISELSSWLFCSKMAYSNYDFFVSTEVKIQQILAELITSEIGSLESAMDIVASLFSNLPTIHELLTEDLNAVLEFDPAAKSRNEVLLAYPGFFAITVYRLAHELWNYKVPVLARLFAEFAHGKTGIDIHPAATIGRRFIIDHGTGVVIGETTTIGDDVKIYQGVTLGALSVSKDMAREKRHPTIEDGVIIYSNATILGGKTTIGQGAVIGGNVWITSSIPAQSMVYHKSEIIVKDRQIFPEAINFSI